MDEKKKRLGAAMKATQQFQKMKNVYNNECCTRKVLAIKDAQKKLSKNLRL